MANPSDARLSRLRTSGEQRSHRWRGLLRETVRFGLIGAWIAALLWAVGEAIGVR